MNTNIEINLRDSFEILEIAKRPSDKIVLFIRESVSDETTKLKAGFVFSSFYYFSAFLKIYLTEKEEFIESVSILLSDKNDNIYFSQVFYGLKEYEDINTELVNLLELSSNIIDYDHTNLTQICKTYI